MCASVNACLMALSLSSTDGASEFLMCPRNTQIVQYALTLGGFNTTHGALKQWDPLITNYPRLFMVRKPLSLQRYFVGHEIKFDAFKHLLEYGNLGVSGLQNPSVEFDEIKGGYGGRSFEIPKGVTDGTNEFDVDFNVFMIRGIVRVEMVCWDFFREAICQVTSIVRKSKRPIRSWQMEQPWIQKRTKNQCSKQHRPLQSSETRKHYRWNDWYHFVKNSISRG